MTRISPLHARDSFDLYLSMHSEADLARLQRKARTGMGLVALVAAALITGYLLGAASVTAKAMPSILAEAQVRAAW